MGDVCNDSFIEWFSDSALKADYLRMSAAGGGGLAADGCSLWRLATGDSGSPLLALQYLHFDAFSSLLMFAGGLVCD